MPNWKCLILQTLGLGISFRFGFLVNINVTLFLCMKVRGFLSTTWNLILGHGLA